MLSSRIMLEAFKVYIRLQIGLRGGGGWSASLSARDLLKLLTVIDSGNVSNEIAKNMKEFLIFNCI